MKKIEYEKQKRIKETPPSACPECGQAINEWKKCVNGCGFYVFNDETGQHEFQKHIHVNATKEFKKIVERNQSQVI